MYLYNFKIRIPFPVIAGFIKGNSGIFEKNVFKADGFQEMKKNLKRKYILQKKSAAYRCLLC